ncbi:hypothetical protein RUM43_006074, partial [Polyplax serrata]
RHKSDSSSGRELIKDDENPKLLLSLKEDGDESSDKLQIVYQTPCNGSEANDSF